MSEELCNNKFRLRFGYFCELPKGHTGKHETTCPNPQFHQTWENEEEKNENETTTYGLLA